MLLEKFRASLVNFQVDFFADGHFARFGTTEKKSSPNFFDGTLNNSVTFQGPCDLSYFAGSKQHRREMFFQQAEKG